MIPSSSAAARLVSTAVLAFALAGCALLGGSRTQAPSLFALEATFDAVPAHGTPPLTILVAAPVARPGYDSARMVYVTRAYELRFFARHEWVGPPAQMLALLLAEALERGGRFRTVQSPSDVAPEFRLETEILALQQEFTLQPSQVRFALRAQMVDVAEHRVVGSEDFEAVEPAPSDDPYGGVVAANRAVARVLEDLAKWCDARAPGRDGLD